MIIAGIFDKRKPVTAGMHKKNKAHGLRDELWFFKTVGIAHAVFFCIAKHFRKQQFRTAGIKGVIASCFFLNLREQKMIYKFCQNYYGQ